MNSFKVMQVQAKSMKVTRSSARGWGNKFKFLCVKKCLANGEELNAIVALAVAKAVKMTKENSQKDNSDLEDDNNAEQFISDHLNISSDCE